MPKGLKRYYGRGDLHFLTSSCYRRLPLLKTRRARNLFVHALGKIRERYKFLLVGYVVMPNHLHLLISECPPTGKGPTILCAKKGPVVQKIKNDRTGHVNLKRLKPGQCWLTYMDKNHRQSFISRRRPFQPPKK
jgi:REP-associated tyrosine transposase